jgi:hypothetical protein
VAVRYTKARRLERNLATACSDRSEDCLHFRHIDSCIRARISKDNWRRTIIGTSPLPVRLKDTSVGQEHGIDAHEQGHPLPAVRLPSLAKEHVENRSTPRAKRSLSLAQCRPQKPVKRDVPVRMWKYMEPWRADQCASCRLR